MVRNAIRQVIAFTLIFSLSLQQIAFALNSVSVQVEPFSASASAPIPITVPQGRAGIQPNLALVYNSGNNRTGLAGVGWTLDLGSIERSTKKGAPKYDATDTFVMTLSGQNLVIDAQAGIYRTEIESDFVRIDRYTPNWVITDKKGTKYYFGNTDDSRQYDGARVFRWALNRVEDINGNYMTISYLRDRGQIYPEIIKYTGNSKLSLVPFAQVKISYVNNSAAGTSYLPGFMVVTGKRIDRIDSSVGTALQSAYKFSYIQSADTKRDLLKSVVQLGADGVTSLPAVTFDYNQINNKTFSQASGWNIPPLQFLSNSTDNGVRLVDLNADGYPDFIQSKSDCATTTAVAYIHNKINGWTVDPAWTSDLPGFIQQCTSPSQRIYYTGFQDAGVRFADVNSDGYVDLVKNLKDMSGTASQTVWINDHTKFVKDPAWALLPSDIYFAQQYARQSCGSNSMFVCPGGGRSNGVYIGTNVTGFVFADYDADGYPDIVGNYNGASTELNLFGKGQKTWQNINYLLPTAGDYLSDTTMVDLNGDGLPEIFSLTPSASFIYMNTGNGWIQENNSKWLTGVNTTLCDLRGYGTLADMNGDGLVDLVCSDGVTQKVYSNTGDGWTDSLNWGLPQFTVGTTRLADVNGDGLTDYFVVSGPTPQLWLNPATTPSDILTSLNNGTGAQTTIEYDSALHYPNTALAFPIQVVKSTKVAEAFGSSYTTRYSYGQGLFDATDREFRGFGSVKTIDPEGNYTISQYHQDKYFKGRLNEQSSYNPNGGLYGKTVNTWQHQTISPGIEFVSLKRTDNYVYDGNSSGKRTAQEFFYGQFGNVEKIIQYGEVQLDTGNDIGADKLTVETLYLNNPSAWVIGLPKQINTYDNAGAKVRQITMYYDGHAGLDDLPSLGQLSKKTDWAGAAANAHPSVQYGYDTAGNLKTTTDALGNTASLQYDASFNMFPVTATNALGHQVKTEYYGVDGVALSDVTGFAGLFGQVKSVADANGQKTIKVYDTFSRLTKSISPLDSVQYPSTLTEYNSTNQYSQVTTRERVKSGNTPTIDSVSFYDGLGRVIEEKSQSAVSGQYIVSGQSQYNSRGLPEKKYMPRFTSNGLNVVDALTADQKYTLANYDLMGRIIKTTNADGTYSSVSYDDWSSTMIDENGHEQKSYFDTFGRLIKKEEYKGADGRSSYYPAQAFTLYATTQSFYDNVGNLVKIQDAKGNITTMTYDSLGQKIGMNDPNMGIWTYEYDLNGNLKTQKDPKGQILTFNYDALNRLTNKIDGSVVNVNYIYDGVDSFSKGKLSKVTYDGGSTQFSYDLLGREISSTKTIDGVGYTIERTYDNLNNLTNIKYPDLTSVPYQYNSVGQINTVGVFVKKVDYSLTGQTVRTEYGNGTITTQTYDPLNLRLTRILTVNAQGASLQDLNYTYDPLGNIVKITDNVNTANQSFKYDHLDRLIEANGQSYGIKSYSYDEIGNITNKEGINYTYSNKPHAVASLSNGTTFAYDNNGNTSSMTKDGVTTNYVYDKSNRLKDVTRGASPVASYGYDGDGGRVKKAVYQSGAYKTTYFVGDLYESVGTDKTSHIYLGPSVAVSKINNTLAYSLKDHLGGTNIITDSLGAKKELIEYLPFGGYAKREKYGAGSEVSSFQFTGKKLDDETSLYYFGARYYNPLLGKFITPDTIVQNNNPQNLNRYSYCANNPINRVDPTGNSWFKKAFAKWATMFSPFFNAVITGEWEKFAITLVTTIATVGIGLTATSWMQYALEAGGVGAMGAALNRGDAGKGFLTGAAGGVLAHAGGDVVTQKFFGAGVVGNVINAGGQSLIDNAVSGRAWNSSFTIYAGPLSINVGNGVKPTFGLSSLSSLYYLGQAVHDPTAKFNFLKTLSAGTPVFEGGKPLNGSPYGRTMGNVIYLGSSGNLDKKNSTGKMQSVFGHERYHAIIQGRLGGGTTFGTDAVEGIAQTQKWYNAGTPGARQGATKASWQFEVNAQQHDLWGG